MPDEHFVRNDEDEGVAAVDAVGSRLDESRLTGAPSLHTQQHEVFVRQEPLSSASCAAKRLGFAQLALRKRLSACKRRECLRRQTEVGDSCETRLQ